MPKLFRPSGPDVYRYGVQSQLRLDSCEPAIQEVFRSAIRFVDIKIIDGHRSEERQKEMFAEGLTQLRWPDSNHNRSPSRAVDAIPYPFRQKDWNNIPMFSMFAGLILGIAAEKGIPMRAGIDWNRNLDPSDNWVDGPHFELWEG